MHLLARFTRRFNLAILVATLVISAAMVAPLPLAYDDDVIRFLPQGDPDVVQLQAIADRFGSIHVALVGVEAPELFTPERLAYVRELTLALRKVPQVAHVTSITELAVVDTARSKDGAEAESVHRELVPRPLPADPAAVHALRDDVLKLDYLVGSLISHDGSSTLLVAQLHESLDGERVSTTQAAAAIQKVAAGVASPPDTRLHYGGAPFIAEAAANGTQRDLARLAPWVCGIIVLLIFVSLGSARAALLALITVGLGILWTMGVMGWLGQPLTLVSTSLPVILTALGSAYAVHLLVSYLDHEGSVEIMLQRVGWPVTIAGATTVAGFISFLVMDLAPMREFGWQMAMGTAICGLVAMLVIPAFLWRWPIRGRRQSRLATRIDDLLVRMALSTRRRRAHLLLGTGLVAAFFAWHLQSVQTRMDTRSFFEAGSPPDLADRFLTEKFSGSVFLQVLVTGDVRDPLVLRQVADFEDRLHGVEGVTRIESITNVLGLVNEALGGRRHLADTREAITYHGYLAENSDAAVRLLVDPEWRGALIQVAIGGFDTEVVRRVTREIRQLAREHLPRAVVAAPRSPTLRARVVRDAAERIAILTGGKASADAVAAALSSDDGLEADEVRREIAAIVDREIGQDEMIFVKEQTDLKALAGRISADVLRGDTSLETLRKRLSEVADAEELEDPKAFGKSARYVHNKVERVAGRLLVEPIVARVTALAGPQPDRVRYRVAAIVYDLIGPTWHVPANAAPEVAEPRPMTVAVSGYPVVQEAMTQSVQRNQVRSLMASLPLVFIILVLVFRNPLAGLVGMVPTALTLLVTFGLMGLFSRRLPLDIGSSMLASIALGVGIDYAIHFLWRYRETGLSDAMRTTGRAIVINAAEITAGFIVLAFASIVPMSNFGLLIAETLAVAALATLVLMPAMIGWWKPHGAPAPAPSPPSEKVAQEAG